LGFSPFPRKLLKVCSFFQIHALLVFPRFPPPALPPGVLKTIPPPFSGPRVFSFTSGCGLGLSPPFWQARGFGYISFFPFTCLRFLFRSPLLFFPPLPTPYFCVFSFPPTFPVLVPKVNPWAPPPPVSKPFCTPPPPRDNLLSFRGVGFRRQAPFPIWFGATHPRRHLFPKKLSVGPTPAPPPKRAPLLVTPLPTSICFLKIERSQPSAPFSPPWFGAISVPAFGASGVDPRFPPPFHFFRCSFPQGRSDLRDFVLPKSLWFFLPPLEGNFPFFSLFVHAVFSLLVFWAFASQKKRDSVWPPFPPPPACNRINFFGLLFPLGLFCVKRVSA